MRSNSARKSQKNYSQFLNFKIMLEPKFGAPNAQVQGTFTAPELGSSRVKLPVELIPQGLQLCTIFGVVALGTHMESFGGQQPVEKNKIMICYEFPQYKRKFYEEDTELRSSAILQEMVFMPHSDRNKGKLRMIIEAVCQKQISDEEAKVFDVGTLIGTSLVVNVQHYTKKNGETGQKIVAFAPSNGFPQPHGYLPDNDRWVFHLDKELLNFRSEMFAKLPGFLRTKLIQSKEGQAYIANGGLFAKLENDNSSSSISATSASSPASPAPAPAPVENEPKVQMLVNDHTYDAYIKSGWTDATLVQAGKAKWVQPVAPPAPSAPTPPPAAPSAPTPMQEEAKGWLEDEDEDLPY